MQTKKSKLKGNALMSSQPGGLTPGNPRAFAPRHCQIPPTQCQYSSTKSYHCPFPREHNLKKISLEHELLLRRHHSDRFLAKNIFTLLGMDDQQKGTELPAKRKTRLHFSPSPFWKPVNAVWIFHFQDGGDVTNPAGLSPCILPRKCKSGLMAPSRAKIGRQKSANLALFPRMSPGSSPRDGR